MIVKSPEQVPFTVTSLKVTIGFSSQLSVAVAVPKLIGDKSSLHSAVILGGNVSTGAIVSSTKIVCETLVKLPQL